MLKNWLISIGLFFGIFFIGTFIITIFNYFNFFSSNIISILKMIVCFISIFIAGYHMGCRSKQKGYLEGIKIGLTIIGIFNILILLFDKVSIKSLLYDFILLLTAILGSMIGINRKKNCQ